MIDPDDLDRLVWSILHAPACQHQPAGTPIALVRLPSGRGWVVSGPYKEPFFVEPGDEGDCHDFAVPGISAVEDAAEALALCLAAWGRSREEIAAQWGPPS